VTKLAATYASPEAAHLPQWAVWNYEAYSVTAEPVAIAFNKGLLPAAEIPKTHTDLARLLAERAEALKGKIATYDPDRSASRYPGFAVPLRAPSSRGLR
jgi:iron(III) transport system substrate-binding protein